MNELLHSIGKDVGGSRLLPLKRYAPTLSLHLKMECDNPYGSSKDRTGLYLLRDILAGTKPGQIPTIVESTSGNLGMALGAYTARLGIPFLCLVDRTLPEKKLTLLQSVGARVEVVEKGDSPDCRTARFRRASELDATDGYAWTRQYENVEGMRAHEETTGPEIWEQTHGEVQVVVSAIGSGGTVCGIGRALKSRNAAVCVVAVEPTGSTIFGGTPQPYLTAGAGFRGMPKLVAKFGSVIDYWCNVDDASAVYYCRRLLKAEGLSVGITTGAALAAAASVATTWPSKTIVVVSPDGGDAYRDIVESPTSTEALQLASVILHRTK